MRLRARWLVAAPDDVVEGVDLMVEAGRVVARVPSHEIHTSTSEPFELVDLGDVALTPGLVDAHAHLDLTDLAGAVAPGASFPDWIVGLLRARGAATSEASSAVARGLERLATTGCVAVGDIAASWTHGELDARRKAGGPITRTYLEVLDAGDDARGRAAVERALAFLDGDGAAGQVDLLGISPHAPYTVGDATLDALASGIASRGNGRSVPLQVHWAETPEEEAWTGGRTGPFDALLGPPQGRGRALDRLERRGLLGPATVLVHGNVPDDVAAGTGRNDCGGQDDEPTRIARADASVVHCPGAHAFFARAPFPVERYRAAGVRLCLGTDSAAGNDDLDMRRELALAAAAFPHVPLAELWGWATCDAARALGLGDRVGVLGVGRPFTAVAFATAARSRERVLDELVRERPEVRASWIEGRQVVAQRSPR
ncbi:Aminodeoxyfutalosine deaminase [Planctomycetes bacterium Pla163]|uniref:Aminodeoxyfutalosine deaminase n=2 Tax=Rohdeia mirabilis TaxID=2528008 RepID=A0A518D2P4_9BACT|nr:Aminodeoxyfutalosine deaminase [Planctomycetes bacterium Pla163]